MTKRTELNQHKKKGKVLITPFNSLPMNTSVSRKNDKIPELLWIILLINGLERSTALTLFRNIIMIIQGNKDRILMKDLTQSELYNDQDIGFAIIKEILKTKKEYIHALLPLKVLLDIPEYSIRGDVISKKKDDDSILWNNLGDVVQKCLDHQSQESTDCRRFKLMFAFATGKISVAESMKEQMVCIFEYPDKGDMTSVRPYIRAMEMALGMSFQGKDTTFDADLTKRVREFLYEKTACVPYIPKKNIEFSQFDHQELQQFLISINQFYLSQCKTSEINPKLQSAFGLIIYTLRLLIDLARNNPSKATQTIIFRTIFECRVALRYLVKNNNNELWLKFRKYGIGKSKLAFLKNQDISNLFDITMIEHINNEDCWDEFIDINLGDWDEGNIRERAEQSGIKKEYDKYFDYTSGFVHGNRSAIRETCYTVCLNPLHRNHQMPFILPQSESKIIKEIIVIINKMLDDLELIYPGFTERI